MNAQQINDEIRTFCNRMSEHVDSIRVIATCPENGSTAMHSHGQGNWYAQKGIVEEWLANSENYSLAFEIVQQMDEEPPDN